MLDLFNIRFSKYHETFHSYKPFAFTLFCPSSKPRVNQIPTKLGTSELRRSEAKRSEDVSSLGGIWLTLGLLLNRMISVFQTGNIARFNVYFFYLSFSFQNVG